MICSTTVLHYPGVVIYFTSIIQEYIVLPQLDHSGQNDSAINGTTIHLRFKLVEQQTMTHCNVLCAKCSYKLNQHTNRHISQYSVPIHLK